MPDPTELWFPFDPTVSAGAPQLVCIPHAGAGAGAYRGWQERLGTAAQVLPVQLPGREYRLGEAPLDNIDTVVAALTGPALQVLRPPYVLFGHSMGALIAFELAHALTARGRPPAHLVVSGFAAPRIDPVERVAAAGAVEAYASDEALVDYVRTVSGDDDGVLAVPEFVEMLLPVMRADFALCASYRFRARPPLAMPLTVLTGRDDPTTPRHHQEPWQEVTTGPTERVVLPGGHIYTHEQLDAVLAVLRRVVGRLHTSEPSIGRARSRPAPQ